MNPETITPDTSNSEVLEANPPEANLVLPPAGGTTASSDDQWKQYGEQIAGFLQALPSYVTRFFAENKGPLGTIGLIFLTLVVLKLTLALVDAINDIPLVAPTLELIGLAYTGWFIYRYLLNASSRQELSQEINNFKEQIMGSRS